MEKGFKALPRIINAHLVAKQFLIKNGYLHSMCYEELPTFFADIFFAIMKYNPKYVMLTIFFQAVSNRSNTGKKGISRSVKAQLGFGILFNRSNQNVAWPPRKDQV